MQAGAQSDGSVDCYVLVTVKHKSDSASSLSRGFNFQDTIKDIYFYLTPQSRMLAVYACLSVRVCECAFVLFLLFYALAIFVFVLF